MKKLLLVCLVALAACENSDEFEPAQNEFGTQVQVSPRDRGALSQRLFVFHSITAPRPFDFNGDGGDSTDILAQFPPCTEDEFYFFQSTLFEVKFIGTQCEPGISPLDGLDSYVISAQDETNTSVRLIIRNSEDVFQEISIDDFELFENDQGKRTIIGEWVSFEPAFVFDVIMVEIDRPEPGL